MSEGFDVSSLVLKADSTQVAKANSDLDRLSSVSSKTEKSVNKFNKETSILNKQFRELGIGVKIANSAIALLGPVIAGVGISRAIQDVREFETGLVGVRKTTGLDGAGLESFAQNLTRISQELPISTKELLELAQSAGQMGVTGAENLEKFTVTVAKLGRASDISGDEAAKSLARILNVTGEAISEVDKLASVIVRLGNNTAASESEITRITTEVARATSIFGISSAEAAGLGSAMVAMGIRAELGGSSVGRALQEITKRVRGGGEDLKEFANTLGLSADKLTKLFEEDKVAAFRYFLESVNNLGLDAANALDQVNLGGQEIAKTILPLAKNLEIFDKNLALANDEVKNATALNNEFDATLDTIDSKINRFSNNVSALGRALLGLKGKNTIGDSIDIITTSLRYLTDNIDEVIKVASLLAVVFASRVVSSITAAAAAQVAYNIKVLQGKVVTLDSAIAEKQKAQAVLESANAESVKAAALAKSTAAEVRSWQAVVASTKAEIELEMVRLKAQISAKGRADSVNRLAAARMELSVATSALTKAEQAHTASLASSNAANMASAGALGSYSKAAAAATLGSRALAGALGLARGAMAFLGGPIGIAITVASALYIFKDSIFKSKNAVVDLTSETNQLIESLKNMNRTASDIQLDKLNTRLEQSLIDLANARERLEKASGNSKRGASTRVKALEDEVEKLKELITNLKDAAKAYEDIGKMDKVTVEVEALIDTSDLFFPDKKGETDPLSESIRDTIEQLKKRKIELTEGERALFIYENANNSLAVSLYDQVSALEKIKAANDDNKQAIASTTEELEKQLQAYQLNAKQILEANLIKRNATEEEIKHNLALYDKIEAYKQAEKAVESYLDNEQKHADSVTATISDTERSVYWLRREIAARQQGKSALAALNKEMFIENGLRSDAAKQLLPEEIERYKQLLAAQYDAQEAVKELTNKTSIFADQAARNIQDKLGSTLRKTMDGSFEGILESWENLIKDMVAEATAAKIAEQFNFEGIFNGGEGGGLGGSIGEFMSKVFNTNSPNWRTGGITGTGDVSKVLSTTTTAANDAINTAGDAANAAALTGAATALTAAATALTTSATALTGSVTGLSTIPPAITATLTGVTSGMASVVAALNAAAAALTGAATALTGAATVLSSAGATNTASGLIGGAQGASSLLAGLPSFDGGGYTWDGPRFGGVDGKGGKLGIIHSKETVVDHTKSGQNKFNRGVSVQNNFIMEGRPDLRTQTQIANKATAAQRRVSSRFGT